MCMRGRKKFESRKGHMSEVRMTRRNFLQTTSMVAGAVLTGTSAVLVESPAAQAQTSTGEVASLLRVPLETQDVVEFQIREYLMKRVPALPSEDSAAQWTQEQE